MFYYLDLFLCSTTGRSIFISFNTVALKRWGRGANFQVLYKQEAFDMLLKQNLVTGMKSTFVTCDETLTVLYMR